MGTQFQDDTDSLRRYTREVVLNTFTKVLTISEFFIVYETPLAYRKTLAKYVAQKKWQFTKEVLSRDIQSDEDAIKKYLVSDLSKFKSFFEPYVAS